MAGSVASDHCFEWMRKLSWATVVSPRSRLTRAAAVPTTKYRPPVARNSAEKDPSGATVGVPIAEPSSTSAASAPQLPHTATPEPLTLGDRRRWPSSALPGNGARALVGPGRAHRSPPQGREARRGLHAQRLFSSWQLEAGGQCLLPAARQA